MRRLAEVLGFADADRRALLQISRGNLSPSGFSAAAVPLAIVPAPLTSFVGRETELAEIRYLLGNSRLLTLTGTAGVGKTRL